MVNIELHDKSFQPEFLIVFLNKSISLSSISFTNNAAAFKKLFSFLEFVKMFLA